MDKPDHFTAWFRRERRLTQKWAGAPDEKSASRSERERLMPRSSFRVHIRESVGRSKERDNHGLDIAERFNRVFMAYALHTHEKMREDLSNLQEQNRYRNEFLATLAHELRKPLAPIRTGLSVLDREPHSGAIQKVIARMQCQVETMTTMIDALMDVSRVTSGKVKLDRETVMIQDIIRDESPRPRTSSMRSGTSSRSPSPMTPYW
jgi:chemotaxis family two-component system sensor kinase Cph1